MPSVTLMADKEKLPDTNIETIMTHMAMKGLGAEVSLNTTHQNIINQIRENGNDVIIVADEHYPLNEIEQEAIVAKKNNKTVPALFWVSDATKPMSVMPVISALEFLSSKTLKDWNAFCALDTSFTGAGAATPLSPVGPF